MVAVVIIVDVVLVLVLVAVMVVVVVVSALAAAEAAAAAVTPKSTTAQIGCSTTTAPLEISPKNPGTGRYHDLDFRACSSPCSGLGIE